jgi:hypothetical protein
MSCLRCLVLPPLSCLTFPCLVLSSLRYFCLFLSFTVLLASLLCCYPCLGHMRSFLEEPIRYFLLALSFFSCLAYCISLFRPVLIWPALCCFLLFSVCLVFAFILLALPRLAFVLSLSRLRLACFIFVLSSQERTRHEKTRPVSGAFFRVLSGSVVPCPLLPCFSYCLLYGRVVSCYILSCLVSCLVLNQVFSLLSCLVYNVFPYFLSCFVFPSVLALFWCSLPCSLSILSLSLSLS